MAPDLLVPGARHAVAPKGIASTAWPRVERTCRNIGWRFDPWQAAVGRLILAKKSSGSWAADLSIMSIPRQVGKSYLLGCIIFALCLLTPKTRVIWTSHHTATTEEMYEAMKELALHPRVAPHVVRCVALQGSRWRITFRNGSRIDFGSRERGFGRGKSKVDVIVLDEFQHITMRALANLAPTTNAAANPLILGAGTPPGPMDNGEAFTMRRRAAIEGISDDTFYVEFSADSSADLDDRAQWAKANPSFPKRTKERAFLLNRKILDDENFRREFLGIWDELFRADVFEPGAWTSRYAEGRETRPAALGIAVDLDRKWLSLGVASADHIPHVAPVLRLPREKADEFVAEVRRIQRKYKGLPVAIDRRGPASFLIPDLEDAGVKLTLATLEEYVQACADMEAAVNEGGLTQGDYPELDAAVAAATWRDIGERKALGRKKGDISMLEAVTLALWSAKRAALNYDIKKSIY